MSKPERRASWLGWPIWGLAVAAIFLSYNTLAGTEAGLDGLQPWLWTPWVGLGIAGSRAAARALDAPVPGWRERRLWLSSLAGLALFAGVDALLALAPSPAGPNAANLAFSGAIAAGLALVQRMQVGLDHRPGVVLGSLLVSGAYALPELVTFEALRALAAALAVAVGFALVGVMGLRRES